MSGDNFSARMIGKRRPVLGDISNLNPPTKRGAFAVLDDLGLELRGGNDDGNSGFAKRICLGVENLVKDSCRTKFGGTNSKKSESERLGFPLSANVNASGGVGETEDVCNFLDDSLALVKRGVMAEVGDGSRDSCASSGSMPTSPRPCENVCNAEGRLVSNLMGNKRSFELTRCTVRQGDEAPGADLLNACSCSFCLKAAYIWSDLHYQDIKGRLGALKKSQKEASILANKYDKGKLIDTHVDGTSNKSSKLETDLMGLWRSLFHHMGDAFALESSQLQSNFVELKNLREDCKIDLERTTGIPPDRI